MNTASDLRDRLRDLHGQTQDTPLFNPVFQLGLDISRELEAGRLSLADISDLTCDLEKEALMARAERLKRLVRPEEAPEALFDPADGLAMVKERFENPLLHVVFTAHPTFLMTPEQSANVAEAATGNGDGIGLSACSQTSDRPDVTLVYEHERAMSALANGQDARDELVRELFGQAADAWPERWHEIAPMPFRFATWVGYDMDGRTDIKWYDSIRFRLAEKAQRLERYAAQLEAIDGDHEAFTDLRAGLAQTQACLDALSGDLPDPALLSKAANRLTQDDPDKLLSLVPLVEQLENAARECDGLDRAIALRTLAAAMRADGLGMGWIHFRVNSSQLRNAIRRRIDPEGKLDLDSRSAIAALRRALNEVEPMRTNFGSLAIETSTAIRQFVAMAQILRHIDADTPIRMLIAECEQATTILSALYFAKMFGIADKVDVSPLFETENALEHGGRLFDALLAEDAYRDYARKRGRIAIQTGFSDAGRFVGQVPASLAIERLQGRLADAMARNDLTDVAALVFNTHGESMGRGAHPIGFDDRLEWPLSAWARARFASKNIRLEPEASYQGGDGYQFFATPELALATLRRIVAHRPQRASDALSDPFYTRTDLSLDFYRAIRDHQRKYLASRTYARAITAFGLGLLNKTGSRVSRRQSDLSADREMNMRQIRAIPHNAVLQQLGYPVNVIAGLGTAASGVEEDMAHLLQESARGRQVVRLVRSANALASIKTVAAFGELFNAAFWASRTYRGTEPHLSDACQALAEYLNQDDRAGTFRRLASHLRVDALKLHRLFSLMDDEPVDPDREQVRRRIGVLQALRLALLQHMFLKAVSVPGFSRANDISREDVLEMIFTLRIDDALAQLRRAYPSSVTGMASFDMDEQADYPDTEDEGYAAIRENYIDPIERSYDLVLRIGAAIAHEFGAHG